MLNHESSSGKAEDKSDFDKIKALLSYNPEYATNESIYESAIKTYNVAMKILRKDVGLNAGESRDSKEFYTLTTLGSDNPIFNSIRKPKPDAAKDKDGEAPKAPAKDAAATPADTTATAPATAAADAAKPADTAAKDGTTPAATPAAGTTTATAAATTTPAATAAAAPSTRAEEETNVFDSTGQRLNPSAFTEGELDYKNIPLMPDSLFKNYLSTGELKNTAQKTILPKSDITFTDDQINDILGEIYHHFENTWKKQAPLIGDWLDAKTFKGLSSRAQVFLKRLLLLLARYRLDPSYKNDLITKLGTTMTSATYFTMPMAYNNFYSFLTTTLNINPQLTNAISTAVEDITSSGIIKNTPARPTAPAVVA